MSILHSRPAAGWQHLAENFTVWTAIWEHAGLHNLSSCKSQIPKPLELAEWTGRSQSSVLLCMLPAPVAARLLAAVAGTVPSLQAVQAWQAKTSSAV